VLLDWALLYLHTLFAAGFTSFACFGYGFTMKGALVVASFLAVRLLRNSGMDGTIVFL